MYLRSQLNFNYLDMIEFSEAGMIGPPQIALIVIVVLLLFGGKKIPELMKGLGKWIKEFKEGVKEDDTNSKDETKADS